MKIQRSVDKSKSFIPHWWYCFPFWMNVKHDSGMQNHPHSYICIGIQPRRREKKQTSNQIHICNKFFFLLAHSFIHFISFHFIFLSVDHVEFLLSHDFFFLRKCVYFMQEWHPYENSFHNNSLMIALKWHTNKTEWKKNELKLQLASVVKVCDICTYKKEATIEWNGNVSVEWRQQPL